jgi:hypothetical protein
MAIFLRQPPKLALTALPLVTFAAPDMTGKRTVHDILLEQVEIRKGIRKRRGLRPVNDRVNPYYGLSQKAGKQYVGASFGFNIDPGTPLTIIKSYYGANEELLVDDRAFVADTLTDEDWTPKRVTARDLAEQISRAVTRRIETVDIVVQSAGCTALLEQGMDPQLLDCTECAGTPPVKTPDGLQFAFASVDSNGSVNSNLNGDRSNSNWGARLVLVR